MALHRAISCDNRPNGCPALYLAEPRLGPDAALYAARREGWQITVASATSYCPSCAAAPSTAQAAGPARADHR